MFAMFMCDKFIFRWGTIVKALSRIWRNDKTLHRPPTRMEKGNIVYEFPTLTDACDVMIRCDKDFHSKTNRQTVNLIYHIY